MYRDSVDALMCLLSGFDDCGKPLEPSGVVSVSSADIRLLRNGIRHCCVQVLFESGAEYRIDAFGYEADELYLMARTHPTFSLVTAKV